MTPRSSIKLSDVELEASKFLTKYNPSFTLPIPIEGIVECQMKIILSVVPGIKSLIGIDAFITSDFSQITIDENSFTRYPERTRFSIAHEIGHLILHKDWYCKYGPKNIDDYLNSHDNVDDQTYKYTEIQAQTFAGLVLVPRVLLLSEISKRFGKIPKNESVEILTSTIVDLPEIFKVSDSVILRRLKSEGIINTDGI